MALSVGNEEVSILSAFAAVVAAATAAFAELHLKTRPNRHGPEAVVRPSPLAHFPIAAAPARRYGGARPSEQSPLAGDGFYRRRAALPPVFFPVRREHRPVGLVLTDLRPRLRGETAVRARAARTAAAVWTT